MHLIWYWTGASCMGHEAIERVQRRVMLITGLEHLFYQGRLKELRLFSLEQALGRPMTTFQYLIGAYKRVEEGLTMKWNDGTRRNGFNLEEDRVRLKLGRNSLLWSCPTQLWILHPQRYSRPGWMGLWAAWSSDRCPYPCQRELELDDL